MTNSFYGKYRGVVTSNEDPSMLGRIRVSVPDVLGSGENAWAMPCAPAGGSLALPAEGAGVWIEFERGDPSSPIWSGVWWGSAAEVPPVEAQRSGKVTVETEGGQRLTLDDTPGVGGIALQTADGQRLVIGAAGIVIENGRGARIALAGPTVSINGDALEVT